jgi:hypothetical protein
MANRKFLFGIILISSVTMGREVGTYSNEALRLLRRESKVARFDADLCQGRTENRSILSLRQGSQGYEGEDDSLFLVKIGDEKPVEILTKQGTLNHAIVVCPEDSSVKVKVWAYEKDLLIDGQSLAEDPRAFEFTLEGGRQERKISKSYVGPRPRKSTVTVAFEGPKLFALPGDAEAPLEASAQRGPAPITVSVGGVQGP